MCGELLWTSGSFMLSVLLCFQFTFAKMWLLFAQFEIRQKNLQGARKVMVSLQSSHPHKL